MEGCPGGTLIMAMLNTGIKGNPNIFALVHM